MKITQAVILPNTKKAPDSNQPDYRVTAKVGEEWVEVGAAWKKKSEKGAYLSVKFGDNVEVEVGPRERFVPKAEEKKADDEFATIGGAPKAQSVNADDVPF